MTVTYQSEDPGVFIEELKGILPEHYDELCVTKDFPLLPDYDAYKRLSDAKMLKAIVCRTAEEVIGYIIFIVQPHLHYKTCLTAFEDIPREVEKLFNSPKFFVGCLDVWGHWNSVDGKTKVIENIIKRVNS